jgi:arabinofuranosyltransferase
VLLRTAWISDDAQITFRTVLNWCHGWGARWNVVERVQAYTHPLWMLLLTGLYLVLGELFVSTMVASLLLTLAAVRVAVVGAAAGPAAIALAALVASKAFVEYASSGLENPLAYLLLAALWVLAARREEEASEPGGTRVVVLVALAALLFLVRYDLVLLALPLLLGAVPAGLLLGARRGALVAGSLPALAWLAAATFYYGSPLPNTFHAKLGAGLPLGRNLEVGLAYLEASARFDPATPVLLLLGLGLALRSSSRVDRGAGIGIAAYLGYVVFIGGDFMLGRFLAAPAFLAAALVARRAPDTVAACLAGCLAFTGLGLMAHGPNLLSGPDHSRRHPAARVPPSLFTDERAYSYGGFGLLAEARPPYPAMGWSPASDLAVPDQVLVWGAVGLYGLGHGPRVHVVDEHALTDAFLARLPARRDWEPKPGHLIRRIPEGYLESIQSGQNRLEDEGLRRLYEQVTLATRGPLLSPARWRAALGLLLGEHAGLVDRERWQRLAVVPPPRGLPVVRGLDQAEPLRGPVRLEAPGVLRFLPPGVELRLASPVRLSQSVDAGVLRMHRLYLHFYLGEEPVGMAELRGLGYDGAALDPELHVLPRFLWGREVDRVVLQVPPDLEGGAIAYLRL